MEKKCQVLKIMCKQTDNHLRIIWITTYCFENEKSINHPYFILIYASSNNLLVPLGSQMTLSSLQAETAFPKGHFERNTPFYGVFPSFMGHTHSSLHSAYRLYLSGCFLLHVIYSLTVSRKAWKKLGMSYKPFE